MKPDRILAIAVKVQESLLYYGLELRPILLANHYSYPRYTGA